MKIVIDSREQKPLFKNGVVKKLDVGDYSIYGLEDKICIERKSLTDLFGTLGQGHQRFKKELQRAMKLDYFAIVVDGDFTKIQTKNFDGAEFIKMEGGTVTKILMTLHHKYKINMFFTKGRNDSKRLIRSLFESYIILQDSKILQGNTTTQNTKVIK